jgi:transposase-like protein
MPGLVWRRERPVVMPRARKYPVELLERATRLVFESGCPIAHVVRDLGVSSETLGVYVR